MIEITKQQELFIAIGNLLDKKITAYAIGGTAMMLLEIKEKTKDIDLVFKTEKERLEVIKVLKRMGFSGIDPEEVYKKKKNTPVMYKTWNARIDLFLEEIIYFKFTEKMQERIVAVHEYGKNLKILVANPQDIIILKCATDRDKDIDDAKTIIQTQNIRWDEVIKAAEEQVELGKIDAVLELGHFLEKMRDEKTKIPIEVLDKLYEIVKNQIREKQKKLKGITS